MVDAIISAVVEKLTSMMLSSIEEEVKLVTGVKDEVKKLVSNFKAIQAVLDDAEEQQLKEASVKNWLLNLKAVSYDIDDVLDKWKTSQLQHQHKVPSIFCCICFTTRDVGLRHVVAREIREIQQRLDGIATDKARYQLSPSQKTENYIERRVTTSFIDVQKIKGRDEEKDEVKRKILEAKSNPHIISLVGLGGIGKTTLARLVYNDSEIKTHFDKKIWVCVSKPFNEIRIAKAILESLHGSSLHDLTELDSVFKEISASLSEKSFLLVLDDVWNENRSKWEELEKIFKFGLPGSTIMVTTRNEKVAIVMGCNPKSIHKVELLTSEECWSIISQIALVQGDRQKLESIGRRIANKCKGLPLTATTVGGLLRSKQSEKEWLRVLEKKEWEGEDILDPLKLSYYDLPLPLKQCFSYCAIFPKDSEIEKRSLIKMWMAQGFLNAKEDKDVEIVGETYFENLVARSLLQISVNKDNIYMLHDMVSDLAQTFTENEIEVLKDTELNRNSLHAEANVRHLTLTIENDASFLMSIYGLNKLRSLIIQFVGYRSSFIVDAVKHIFNYLTCLRTLDLSKCGIKEVPSSIKKLVHLRWINLSENRNLEKLPETLCECYNLQTLILNWCPNLVELPKGIGKLINLMYLDIEDSCKIKYLPKGIGNLWLLRELTVFIISMNDDELFSIVGMEKLNNLRGILKIRGLGNVRNLEEARKAQLMRKKNVTDLSLSFDRDDVQEDRDDVREDEEALLEALEPPSDLEVLSIKEYEGKRLFPSWTMKLNLLRVLKLQNCSHCEELPPLGKLSCLEKLYLQNMGVKRVGVEFMGIKKEKDSSTSFVSFPKLKVLQFWISWEWEDWDDVDEGLMERITVMPFLQELTIFSCPKLRTLPYRLLSSTISRLQLLNIKYSDALQQEIQKYELSEIPHLEIMS